MPSEGMARQPSHPMIFVRLTFRFGAGNALTGQLNDIGSRWKPGPSQLVPWRRESNDRSAMRS